MVKIVPLITINELKEELKTRYQEGFITGERRPILVLGPIGIGKTSIAEQVALECGISWKASSLANYRKHDLVGIPIPNTEKGIVTWLKTDVLPHEHLDGPRGILLLDEITLADPETRGAVLTLIGNGRLENYVLPKDWYIFLAGNHEGENETFYSLSKAFLNRCSVYVLNPSLDDYKLWAMKNNIHPLVIAYLSFIPSSLYTEHSDEELTISVTPRGWTEVSRNLWLFDNNRMSGRSLYLNVASVISTIEADKFFAFCKFREQSVPIEEVLLNKCNKVFTSKEILHIIVQGCIHNILEDFINNVDKTKPEVILNKFINFFNWLFIQGIREMEVLAIEDIKRIIGREKFGKFFFSPRMSKECPKLDKFVLENSVLFS